MFGSFGHVLLWDGPRFGWHLDIENATKGRFTTFVTRKGPPKSKVHGWICACVAPNHRQWHDLPGGRRETVSAVGGFSPTHLKKICNRQKWESSPGFGVNIKNNWKHHLVSQIGNILQFSAWTWKKYFKPPPRFDHWKTMLVRLIVLSVSQGSFFWGAKKL